MDSPLKGKVLIASPELLDPNFARSVVLIVHHDHQGAMGLIINRALNTTVGEAWAQVSSVPYPNGDPLFQGGPCEGPLMVLHGERDRGQLEVGTGVYLTSDADGEAVRAMVADAVAPMKFFVGYAGWTAMQLEAEVAEGAWAVAEVERGMILDTPGDAWEKLHRRAREAARGSLRPAIDPRRIPPDPRMN
jgi:putative transcriptional regulator